MIARSYSEDSATVTIDTTLREADGPGELSPKTVKVAQHPRRGEQAGPTLEERRAVVGECSPSSSQA